MHYAMILCEVGKSATKSLRGYGMPTGIGLWLFLKTFNVGGSNVSIIYKKNDLGFLWILDLVEIFVCLVE